VATPETAGTALPERTRTDPTLGQLTTMKRTATREGKSPLIAIFGGISLRRQKDAILKDQSTLLYKPERSELSKRLLAEECEICGETDKIEVHHIRKLADLKKEGRREKPFWAKVMATRRRKTLVLCDTCHDDLHAGRLQKPKSRNEVTGEPDAGKLCTSGSEGGRRKRPG
jgi:hypothetical protein